MLLLLFIQFNTLTYLHSFDFFLVTVMAATIAGLKT